MKSDAKRSVFWSGIQNIVDQAIRFIITIIIARILTPEDYGLIAMLSIFFGLAQAFIDSGLSGALIQKRNCSEKDYNSVFVFALVVSTILYTIIYICSPLIANLYNNDLLIDLSRVYLSCLVINAIGLVPMTIMHKNLLFKQYAYVTTGINIFSGVAAITAAYIGLAYWALVFQIMISSVSSTISYFIITKWRPTMSFSIVSFKSMISYGFPVLLTSIVHAIYNNLYSLVIGAKYNSKELGIFNRAYSFATLVPTVFSDFTMRAMFPVLSRIQDNRKELVGKVLEMIHLSMYVVVPINFYLIFNCSDVICIILGEKWLELVPYLSLLCVSCLAYVYTNIHMTIFKVIGKTKILFFSETARKVLGLVVITITVPHGVMVMVYGFLVYSVIDVIISATFLNYCLRVGVINQILESINPVIFSMMAGGCCYLMSGLIEHLYLRFFICLLFYAITYLTLSVLFKERGFLFFKNYFK